MIAAAGSGQRLGAGGPKAFVEVGGKALVEWSVGAFAASCVDEVVVVVPAGHEDSVEAHAVAGGATRAESVVVGLKAVRGGVVVVHDAARPLVTAELIDRVVGRLKGSEADGVIAATPVADTLKSGREGVIEGTVERSALWSAQTPQAFRVEALRAAQQSATDAGELELATDEAWLIERVGGTVLLEESGAPNLKITDSADLAIAETLLSR